MVLEKQQVKIFWVDKNFNADVIQKKKKYSY